jgi:hypothetical protein
MRSFLQSFFQCPALGPTLSGHNAANRFLLLDGVEEPSLASFHPNVLGFKAHSQGGQSYRRICVIT